MPTMRFRWNRLFVVYFTVAGVCLAAGLLNFPFARVELLAGLAMLFGFVPLVMAIYFLRGLLRIS